MTALTFHRTLTQAWQSLAAHRREAGALLLGFAVILTLNKEMLDLRTDSEMRMIEAQIGVDPREIQSAMFWTGVDAMIGHTNGVQGFVEQLQQQFAIVEQRAGVQSPEEFQKLMTDIAQRTSVDLLPYKIAYWLILLTVGPLGGIAFLVLAAEGGTLRRILHRSISLLVPTGTLTVLVALASLVWLPFLGLALLAVNPWIGFAVFIAGTVAMLLMMPRFAVSTLLLIDGEKVGQCVRRSWLVTRPFYWKIIGYSILFTVGIGMAFGIAGSVVPWVLGLSSRMLGTLGAQMILLCWTAFAAAFNVALGRTILSAKPKKS